MTTNLINKLADDLLSVANTGCLKVHICHWDNETKARPANHTIEAHPVFGIFNNEDIRKGLTYLQWYTLGVRVGEFLRSKS